MPPSPAGASGAAGAREQAPERPNILWIVSEDNASQWLGCYGNKEAQTPRIDALAKKSVLFEKAYANAPVCAVSRCTILNGAYSVTLGTQNMRSRHAIPTETFKPYVSYLREQGYYCTNNAKTDYNFKGNDASLWDMSSNQAHYKNRPTGKPFFAVFNIEVSHESNLFPPKVKTNREKGLIQETPRLDPKTLSLPPYVPDLPEMRSDWAIYHDTITAMDKLVGAKLDELEKSGQADNTIVFYYSDHGGPTPRGKRYLEDTGVHIPLLVHVPKKWQALSPFAQGQRVSELVSFVDFAPTLLSLCGQKKPAQMQGRAFLGTERVAPPKQQSVFLFADRFDELYGMRRALTDGRFKYIRRFMPHLPSAPYSYYQMEIPGWAAWQKAWKEGTLTGYHKALWEPAEASEELFDTQSDPWEIKNLAGDAAQAGRLKAMREQLKKTMTQVRDTALIPEPMYAELVENNATIYAYVNSPTFPLSDVAEIAFLASAREIKNLPALTKALKSTHPVIRYWGALGCVALGKGAVPATEALTPLLTDVSSANRITAAHALIVLGQADRGKAVLLAELDKPTNEYAQQLLVNTIGRLSLEEAIPALWVERILKDDSANEYLKRLATRLSGAAKPAAKNKKKKTTS
ncbi:sulfatase-like hydrolase/transferase [Armatimonas sp.]|uniref:sulfatase-like hydrolase/transferase n=1 Tax=Armatimonas sp. TaxID=1872638 RepID=UPI002869F362|nr:sulfatase-like hydrolase/transferase [Armatimonas sp.]